MQKKIKATSISRVKYLISKSNDSDMNRVLKKRQHLKKNMMINKNKEKDIDQLIFSFSQKSDLIITSSTLNSRDDLKKYLDNTQTVTKQSQIQMLREIEHHCKLYLKLNTSMKAAIENVIDNNDLHFNE